MNQSLYLLRLDCLVLKWYIAETYLREKGKPSRTFPENLWLVRGPQPFILPRFHSIWKLTKKISAKNRVTGKRHLHRSTSFVAFASHHRHFASKTLDFDPLWQANRKERWLQHKQQIFTDITDENDPENLTRLNLEQTNTFWGEVLVSDAKIDCVFGFPWVSFFVFWI